jgi:hypothetical protein
MRLAARIMVASLHGLMVLGVIDCALAAVGPPAASCLSGGLAGLDGDTITVDAVSLPPTVKCPEEEPFLGEIKRRVWLAWIARARPRLLQGYDYDVQLFAWATWSTPIVVRVTQCPRRTGAPVASPDCVPSFALEEGGGNDIANLAALEAVAVALATRTSWCALGSYNLRVRLEPSRASDQARVGPAACLLLRSESPELRTLAAESLGSMRRYVAKRAMAALRQAESDPDPRVQGAVRTAEEQIRDRAKQRRQEDPTAGRK